MAMQKLYITGRNVERTKLGNAISTEYAVHDGVLTTFWKDEKMSMPVKAGTMFIAMTGGGLPKLTKVNPPMRREDTLMWAIGVPKPLRAYSQSSFERIVAQSAADEAWALFQSWTSRGPHWAVSTCSRPGCGGYTWLGAFIDARGAKVDKAFAKEFLVANHKAVWPAPFLGRVLQAKFGLSDEEWEELIPQLYASNSPLLDLC